MIGLFIKGSLKGQSPFKTYTSLSFEGEGDKGGEVDKQSYDREIPHTAGY